MQQQKPTNLHKANHSHQQQSTTMTFTLLHVQLQFQQQKPIHLPTCHLQTSQQSIIITSQTSPKPIHLQIPFFNILCVGKKASTTTLVMVKDKQKQIEIDEDGYELVDQQDDQQEQFEEKTNQLYNMIIKGIDGKVEGSHLETTRIVIDQKCNILLTITSEPQQTTTQSTSPSSSSSPLYKHLSQSLQKYQQTLNPLIEGQWGNKLSHLQGLQFGQGYGVEMGDNNDDQDEDQEYEHDNYEDQDSEEGQNDMEEKVKQ